MHDENRPYSGLALFLQTLLFAIVAIALFIAFLAAPLLVLLVTVLIGGLIVAVRWKGNS